jgi:hypothetical protein
MPIIPELRRWSQEHQEFIASMNYIARPCPKNQNGDDGDDDNLPWWDAAQWQNISLARISPGFNLQHHKK